jgi:hypothetical protein
LRTIFRFKLSRWQNRFAYQKACCEAGFFCLNT